MSWQAQTAVTRYSQQTKLLPYKLLHYLADCAAADGTIDPAPSQATMALFLGCKERNLRNHLKTLLESGELEQTRVGSGPGRPSAYRIAPAMIEKVANSEAKVARNEEKVAENEAKTAARLDALEEMVAEIRITIATFVTRNEGKVAKVAKKGGKASVELGADDPYIEPKEEEKNKSKNLPATPGEAKPFDVYQQLLEIEPAMKKGQSLRELKQLLAGGKGLPSYCPEDIVACGRFLQTDPWRINNMVPLTTQAIMDKIGKWLAAGRPATWDDFKANSPPTKNGRHPPGEKPLPDWTKDIKVDERGFY